MQTVSTIGLDIAKSVFQVHGVDANGLVVVRRQLKRRYVLAFFEKLGPCLVGIEACASSHYWSRELQALGHNVRLMPPAYVKPYVKRQKNDMADAEAICEAVTRANMRFVPTKTPEQQSGLVLHRTRHLFIRQQTSLINAIRGHLAEFGVTAPVGRKGIEELLRVIADPSDKRVPDVVRACLAALGSQLLSLKKQLNRLEARSKDLPGIAVPMNAFMGTVGVLPGKPEIDKWLKREKALADAGGAALTPQPVDALPSDLCGTSGTAKDECVRTVPPRENGGNLDTKETVVGTTLLFPCFVDGCGLFAGDVHYAQGGGEVCGTAIEMGAKVTMQAKIMPGMASLLSTMHFEGGAQLKHLAPGSFYAVSGLPLKPEGELPVFSTYLGGQKIAPLANLSEDVSLAARNATLNMIDFLVKTKGLSREQAYVLTSVAVDLNIAQLVDIPNLGVTAILNRDIFVSQ